MKRTISNRTMAIVLGAGGVFACSSILPDVTSDQLVIGDGDGSSNGSGGDGDGDSGGDGDGDGDGPGPGDGDGPIMENDPSCTSSPLNRKETILVDGANRPEAEDALGLMSQDEKIGILSGGVPCPDTWDCDFDGTGVNSDLLNILDFRMRDGPRGVHTHNGDLATTFAVAMARGASYDVNLEYRVGQVQGKEMVALRYDLALSPQINTLRHPRWARAQESYSEDPFALGKFGAAYVLGIQEHVPACPKHYAANNTDENRADVSANMDEQTLRENYTLAFKIVVEESDPGCIMAAYNLVNGEPSTSNRHLLTDILRDDWGWAGFVVSDWWATEPDDGANVLNAGLDLEMPDWEAFGTLPGDLASGAVSSERIDEAAMRILNVRAAFGQLDPEYSHSNPDTNIWQTPEHQAVALETAEKGAVLLQNNGVLPIDASAHGRLVVFGPDANLPRTDTVDDTSPHGMGDRGSSNTNPGKAVSYSAGLSARGAMAEMEVVTLTDTADLLATDLVVIPVTMQHNDEGEAFANGGDRDDMTFGGNHPIHWNPKPTTVINEVAAITPNVIVLQAMGSAVVDDGWMSNVAAIVHTFYPGQEAGTAVANLLFGDVNFYGRLPFTVANSENDYPEFGNLAANVTMEYLHGYRKFEAENRTPRHWLGYGLSYTTFQYSDLELLCDSSTEEGAVNAKVTVTNTGEVAGDDAVLAFIGYPNTGARRPPKELKAFKRTGTIAPGESVDVFFSIPVRDMRYWGDDGWTLEDVEHTLIVSPTADPADPNMQSTAFTID